MKINNQSQPIFEPVKEIYSAKKQVIQNDALIHKHIISHPDPSVVHRLQVENRNIKRNIKNKYNVILE